MRRLGFVESEIPELADMLFSFSRHLKVATVFSHLATADCPELDDYTHLQINTFERITTSLRRILAYPFKRHILNSAGILRFPEAAMDMVRLGIGLYGIKTLEKGEDELKPVASLYTTVVSLKRWKKGVTVGYGCKGVLDRDSLIATLPVGYADGIDRRMGNRNCTVLINGVECPTIGNICMDICMVDVTDVPDCHIGDRVEIFGAHCSINRLARNIGTIPYEILTSISQRIRRIYYRE